MPTLAFCRLLAPLRRLLRGLALCLTLTLATACEGALFEADAEPQAVATFDALWTRTRDVYPYFELKGVNWDSLRTVFRPRVADGMSSRRLFDVCAEMLFFLRDGHVNLSAGFDVSRNWEWYLGAPANFDFNLIERQYLDTALNYRIAGAIRHGVFRRNGRRIGYLYIGAMSSGSPANDIDNALVDMINQRTVGLVLDIRHNGGGRADMAEIIAARFAQARTLAGSISYKSGPGPTDFTPPVDIYVQPEGIRYSSPVVLLTNRSTYSSATYLTQLMRVLPSVTTLGDTTGGGGGLPSGYQLPNGWILRVSASRFRLPDGRDTEPGIPPAVRVDITAADRQNNRDTILEAAFDRLDN